MHFTVILHKEATKFKKYILKALYSETFVKTRSKIKPFCPLLRGCPILEVKEILGFLECSLKRGN